VVRKQTVDTSGGGMDFVLSDESEDRVALETPRDFATARAFAGMLTMDVSTSSCLRNSMPPAASSSVPFSALFSTRTFFQVPSGKSVRCWNKAGRTRFYRKREFQAPVSDLAARNPTELLPPAGAPDGSRLGLFCHYSQINLIDQFGSKCFGSFDSGGSLFRCARVRSKNQSRRS
jgi:hypothetical protein